MDDAIHTFDSLVEGASVSDVFDDGEGEPAVVAVQEAGV